jgi:hypothetical protein
MQTFHEKGTKVNLNGRSTQICVVLVATLFSVLLAAPGASAAFTRPFLREIMRAENPSDLACAEAQAKSSPCLAASGGIAVDGKDDVWIGDANSGGLDEFSPAYAASEPNAFLQTVPIDPPANMAIAGASTGDFYVNRKLQAESLEVFSSTGTHLETSEFDNPAIAIDNSTEPLKDPSACSLFECTVYVFDNKFEKKNQFLANGINKLSSKGARVEFTDANKCEIEKCGYIEGDEITGTPSGVICSPNPSFFEDHITALAVDSDGDIYAAAEACKHVFEYKPSGEYIRDFSVKGTVRGMAFDPVSDRLLVSAEEGFDTFGLIEEFDPATGQPLTQTTERTEGTTLPQIDEIAVDSEGDLYAMEGGQATPAEERVAVYVWGAGRYLPSVKLGSATERKGESVLLNGSVDPEGFQLGECRFQYVSEQVFESEGFSKPEVSQCVPAASAIPAEAKEDAVDAEIQGLTPGTTYRYRLLATSEGALGGSAHTQPLEFTAPSAPEIVSSSAANLSSAFADLQARIAPRGASTSYRFEYLTAAEFAADGESFAGPDPAMSAPVPDGSIGLGGPNGNEVESVVQHIGPLASATTYYYRVVADSSRGAVSGGVCESGSALRPYCTFATLPAAVRGLPDGRSYELVTPATKEGGSDMFALPEANGVFQNKDIGTASESGDGFLLETFSPFGPFPAAGHSAYVFHRNAAKSEWTYTSLSDPALGVQSISEPTFDPVDLSRVGVNDNVGSGLAEEGVREVNLLGEPGGPYAVLHTNPPFHGEPAVVEKTSIVGGSRDLSHVLLESTAPAGQADKACPGAELIKQGNALCELTGGEAKLVNVNSEGEPVNTCGALLGSFVGGGTHQAVSADGSRVFFTAPQPVTNLRGPGCWQASNLEPFEHPGGNPPQVYARIDGTTTVNVSSEAEAGVTEGGKPPVLYPAVFVGASEDGREVFFVTKSWLTVNHPQQHDPELYECEIVEAMIEGKPVSKCKLTRVSAGDKGESSESEGAQVFGVQAVASGGGAVYFLAFGALTPGASKLEANLVDSSEPVNLYRYQTENATAPSKTTYVATVSTNNRSDQGCSFAPCNEEDWYSTPNGRYLLFSSDVDLTANAHTGGRCDIPGSQGAYARCDVIYRYDAHASESGAPPIVCVSCNPNGTATGDGTTLSGGAEFARSAPVYRAGGPVHAMSNDGSYVFFDTPTPLVPQATNGTLDVYEWHEGTISLIGSGAEPGPSFFLGYSSFLTPKGETVEGGNVFIGTHARLIAADTNTVGNIYDARICVPESPCIQPPPGETAQCEGASCQSLAAAPLDATPTSLTFSGPGDTAAEAPPPAKAVTKKAAKCKQGYTKKKGKCVKKARAKQKAKKSSKKRRTKS